jgi:hypothetical protein
VERLDCAYTPVGLETRPAEQKAKPFKGQFWPLKTQYRVLPISLNFFVKKVEGYGKNVSQQ